MSLLFANAFPEPDFKYFSKERALYLSVNEIYVINLTGRRDEVYFTSRLLCLLSLLFKSEV